MADLERLKTIDEQYVLNQYENKIYYYWRASVNNKRAYKRYRAWPIILGALVTLITTMSTAEFVQSVPSLRILFAVTSAIIAFMLTAMNGLGQNFHWGASWRSMVTNAVRLEKERDRFLATNPKNRNLKKELDLLNSIIEEETKDFFQKVLDSEVKPKEQNSSQG